MPGSVGSTFLDSIRRLTDKTLEGCRKVVLLVFPYPGSSQFLLDELYLHGHQVVAVYNNAEGLSEHMSAELFVGAIGSSESGATDVVAECRARKYRVQAVIPASEFGVILAELIQGELDFPRNEDAHRVARRDKELMHARLAECGVDHIQQIRVSNFEEALQAAMKLTFPVVCKPPNAGGSLGVSIARDEKDLRIACDEIWNHSSERYTRFEHVLVCEFIEGTEYVVDCCSYAGQHLLSALFFYRKKEAGLGFAYESTISMQWDSEPTSAPSVLYTYVQQVLTALGIIYGPSHAEIKIRPNGKPVLIEVGSRCHGAFGVWIVKHQAGREYSNAFRAVDVYLNKGRYLRRKITQVRACLTAPYLNKYLTENLEVAATRSGILRSPLQDTLLPVVRELPTFLCTYGDFPKVGDQVEISRDLEGTIASLFLMGKPEDCARDVAAFREIEASGKILDLEENI